MNQITHNLDLGYAASHKNATINSYFSHQFWSAGAVVTTLRILVCFDMNDVRMPK